ncbi:type I DNA topoisomerase [Porphyromonas pasteri]|uniref:DNA topoisomerase 1 n=1 Tax=Porphyromonas pasteri TaxID=1583331 RepID=A0ABQ2H8R8_9PORP|nr:type I DNA topoisomerase [Porphyromonas pasteri]GGM56437.1 DNA topoisomerase 1 [Porphyromonas pasteri]
MNLVIVESPKKAELISGFLKKHQLNDYKVMASAGHVRDLKQHSFSVNVEDRFRPEYVITEDKKSLVRELKAAAKKADLVYLASDEDREGEAIAWHLSEALELKPEKTRRIVFHEITAEAFLHALEHPREVNMNLVDAQQARRVLDRIVGFELSPVLWKRIRPSLSAGRVQSVAVRLIVDREREITAFVPQSSYRLQATFVLPSGERLLTELNHRFATEAEAEALMTRCATADFSIGAITRRAARRSPAAPFTTSTLQQEAAHKLGYSVSQTMRLAQSLYESGHITYMRTDSVNLSSQALGAIARQIEKHPGKEYHQPRRFQTKSKGAQEAHEAIRPTYIDRERVGGTAQEQRLYDLIRKRTLASQMADAEIERTTVSIPVSGTDYAFTAQGEVITFRGFLDVYMESTGEEGNAEVTKLLPAVKEREALSLEALTGEERFTQRPARYTEASMVSKMEELGIGRPSTYAPTIQTIQNRGYVERADREGQHRNYTVLTLKDGAVKRAVKSEVYGADKGKLLPTDVGIVVNDFLVDQFPNIVDYNFTARVEEEFDTIAEGKTAWSGAIGDFYQRFHPEVERATHERPAQRVGQRILGVQPSTGLQVSVSIGRYGPMAQLGTAEDAEKPRFASLQKGQSLETITLEEALALFDLPKNIGEYEGEVMTVAVGRFGPYVRHAGKFYSLPKDTDPLSCTAEQAIEIIREKRESEEKSLLKSFTEDADLSIRTGRFGPYLKYKTDNYKLPKDVDPTSMSYEDCMKLIAETPAKTARKGAARKSSPRAKKSKS